MALQHWTVRQNISIYKSLLKRLAAILTQEIGSRKSGNLPMQLDFRFLLPLSQWLTEQSGYTDTPEGYNPGNVMGYGTAGRFLRKNNTEIVNGQRVVKPAWFAAYRNLAEGAKAQFDHLKDKWPLAYDAILNGKSVAAYIAGLYPGYPNNYATQSKAAYQSALAYRRKNAIADYLLVAKDDLLEMTKNASQLKLPNGLPIVDPFIQREIASRLQMIEESAKPELQRVIDALIALQSST